MTGWVCSGVGGCGETYALHLTRCPRCHNTDFHRDGPMPKISKHGGATDKTLPQPETASEAVSTSATAGPVATFTQVSYGNAAVAQGVNVTQHVGVSVKAAPQVEEGGESSSPGSSSSASTETPPTLSEPNEQPAPKRAPGTGSRSKRARMAASTAPLTATDGRKTEGSDSADS